MVIAMHICIDDNLIAINVYIHGNNHNACGYSYCHVYIYTAITIMHTVMVIAMYICINSNQIVINVNEY